MAENKEAMMSKFYLYLEQSGGCDYTIGCGKLLTLLQAQTWDEAVAECGEKIGDNRGDSAVAEATLIEVKEERVFDVDAWTAQRAELRRAEAEARQQAAKRAEYERLKREFEGGS